VIFQKLENTSLICAIDSPHPRVIFKKIIFGFKIHEKNGKIELFLHHQ
jgi:hypothetical protein